MVASLPFDVSAQQKEKLIEIRNQRMEKALTEIHPQILSALQKLKQNGVQLCLISNADIIDKKHWGTSPLYKLFDCAIFSCDVGIVKPDKAIYQLAFEKMNATAPHCYFVGDGGSNELAGAKECGITTILTEFLTSKPTNVRENILKSADYVVAEFKDIIEIIAK